MSTYIVLNRTRVSARKNEFESILSEFSGWHYESGFLSCKTCDYYEIRKLMDEHEFF